MTIGHKLKALYEEYKNEPYVGIYSFDKPSLMVRDLDLVKNVLVKDSQNFQDHLATLDEDLDPLGARGLFTMKGQKWKHMRNGLTPTFTSGKMKQMQQLRKFFIVTPLRGLIIYLALVAPKLIKTFRLQFMEKGVYDFIRSTVWDTAKYRNVVDRESPVRLSSFLPMSDTKNLASKLHEPMVSTANVTKQ
ncbi:hypothetical protein C0J52_12806 [Blattella germanica]|nr:hypothetical protein C0J52_12806 [Blattella germanica]